MARVRFFKAVWCLFFLVYNLDSRSQSTEVRENIQASYDLEDVAFLKHNFRRNINFGVQQAKPNRLNNLMEVDSLGVALYYKNYNQVSARVSHVTDEAGDNIMGFSGKDMIVGIWDSALPRLDHVDLKESIVVTDNADPLVFSQHATHVAGTMVSKGSVYSNGKGLVYNAKLWANDWTNDFEEMVDIASRGVLVSNHSYGVDPKNIPVSYFGAYLSSSRRLDAITYRFPYYQPVVAAGNDRREYLTYNASKGGGDLLLGMGTAKNAVVVAAVGGDVANDMAVADFSNWGPTDDLRIKPDVAARGVRVFSTLDDSTVAYGALSGTSMATPVVSSVLTIWQEAAIAFLGKPLWSSSMRALLAHSAQSVNGSDAPDYQSGWGMVDSEAGLMLLKSTSTSDGVRLLETDLKQGETHRYRITTASELSKVKATLSWTDPEGEARFGVLDDRAATLVHDLDIRILDAENKSIYPWKLKMEGSEVVAEKGNNKVDNLEQVTAANATKYILEITHKNKLKRGVQSYSLLVSGIATFESVLEEENRPEISGIQVWPNPATDFLVISGIAANTHFEIEVLNVLGKQMRPINSYLQNDNIILEIENLPFGLYVVRISSEAGVESMMFVKRS